VLVKGIFLDDGFDLLPRLAHSQDDPYWRGLAHFKNAVSRVRNV
jgi:hypothetical protein